MIRKASLKVLIITFFGLSLWVFNPWKVIEKQHQDKEYIIYVNDLRTQFASQMQQELGLICIGDMGRMHEKIEEIGLKFNAYRRASIEEARALQLFVMGKLIQAVNAYDKLGDFLDERPFSYRRARVAISFESSNGAYSDGSVAYMSNVTELAVEENRNKIFYDSMDPLTGNLTDLFDEHYEDAVQRIAASPIPLPTLKFHQATPLEEAIDEVLPVYAKEMRENFRFECWSIGGKMADHVEDIAVHFVLVKHTNQEEARKFILAAAERLLAAINSHDKLKDYLSESPFPSSRLKVKIDFKDSYYYGYRDGSMESVTLIGNTISYYQIPPPEDGIYWGTRLFAKESFQEARDKAAQ